LADKYDATTNKKGYREEEARAGTRKKWPWIILLLLLAAAVVIILLIARSCRAGSAMLFFDDDTPVEAFFSGKAKEGSPGMTRAEIQAQLDAADKVRISASINTQPVFPDGASEGNLFIINPPNNAYQMVTSILLDDTGEEIYNSGLIPPNHYIDTDKLAVNLAKGTYKATAYLYARDPDAPGRPLNTASIDLVLTVQS